MNMKSIELLARELDAAASAVLKYPVNSLALELTQIALRASIVLEEVSKLKIKSIA